MEYDKRKMAEEIADKLSNFVNSFTHDKKAFVERIVYNTHRTLQQSICKLMFALIHKWSDCYLDGTFDGRNEATCKICNDIVKTMSEKDEYWAHLPMV